MRGTLGGRPAGTAVAACAVAGSAGATAQGHVRWRPRVPDRQAVMNPQTESPVQVRVEFVALDDPEGQVLEERQLAAIKEVLAWLNQNPEQSQQEPPVRRAA